MDRLFNRRKQRTERQLPPCSAPQAPDSSGLDERLAWFKAQFNRCFDAVFHMFSLGGETGGALIFLSGMIDEDMVREGILKPIQSRIESPSGAEPALPRNPDLLNNIIQASEETVTSSIITSRLQDAVQAVLEGQVVLLLDGEKQLVIFPFASYEKRSFSESRNEVVIRGPKEAFVEDLKINVTMIRRKIKTPRLKMEQHAIGAFTNTSVVVVYIEGLCKQPLIDNVKNRLSQIQMDGVLESSYLEEQLEDTPLSPFPQMQNTERPDIASAALLEGRIVVMVDGTPIVIIAPATFPMFLQSPEDYYQRYYATSWIRWIRYIFMFVSILSPSFYIALTTYHPEMIPANLLLSIAAAREAVPFPAMIEALIMEITFEALREASIRIPSAIGQAVSILGTLVIGEAAVRAGIVSAPMVIIVSLTGISSFIVPSYSIGLTLRLLRFPIMLLAGSFGLLGLSIGVFLVMLHLSSMQSFGTPYLSPLTPFHWSDFKDFIIRAPWPLMRKRPTSIGKDRLERVAYSPSTEQPDDKR